MHRMQLCYRDREFAAKTAVQQRANSTPITLLACASAGLSATQMQTFQYSWRSRSCRHYGRSKQQLIQLSAFFQTAYQALSQQVAIHLDPRSASGSIIAALILASQECRKLSVSSLKGALKLCDCCSVMLKQTKPSTWCKKSTS